MGTADSFAVSTPHPFAIYLPAVNSSYARVGHLSHSEERHLPVGLALSDFEFWTGNSKLWNHKFLLHSVGNYGVGRSTKGSLFSRAKGSFTIVGDSGGYQIGKGKFRGIDGLYSDMSADDAICAWNDGYDAKCWIIRWLDHYCDYAMTIDMPLWATLNRGRDSPFHLCSEAQLLAMSNSNLRIIQELTRGKTKWLNVVQATTLSNGLRWWDGVKWFKHGGWALGGVAGWRGGLYIMLNILLTMRDDNAFDPGQDWIHVLGVSQMRWDIFLTAIQNGLRRTNPQLQVSFDSATAFKQGGQRDEYAVAPALGSELKNWSIKFQGVEHLGIMADAAAPVPFPASSPLGDLLSMHHLLIDDSDFKSRRFDSLSNFMLINHSLWVFLDAGRRANAAAFTATQRNIPDEFARAIDVIEQAFLVENWRDFLDKERVTLDAAAKCLD